MTAWTERVRVGTAVLLLPLYHPVIVAKQLADLDSRSGGRVTVGVGVGGEFRAEFDAVGRARSAERGARTDEAIEMLRALWSGRAGHATTGKFFDFDERRSCGRCSSRPGGAGSGAGSMQPGGPPLSCPGRKEPAMRRAARLGDGWMPYLVSPDAYARSVRDDHATRRAASAGTSTGFEWLLYLYCSVRARRRPGPRRRRGVPRRRLRRQARRDARPHRPGRHSGGGRRAAAALRDAGARHIVISPAAHRDTLEVVALAAREVLPRLTVPKARDRAG